MKWAELEVASIEEVLAWAEPQSWCREMAACDQDAEWHAEGDVWTHTKLVCQCLLDLEEWNRLSQAEQCQLLFAALFHDAAKPQTSQVDPETGHIVSPRHALKGEVLARRVLRELDCDLKLREEICKLVRYHGRPVFLSEQEEPVREIVKMSWLSNNRLLYLLAKADARGRTTESQNRPIENLEYWKLLAEENGCYERPYEFANHETRLHFLTARQPNLAYEVYQRDANCKVLFMSGLPGSGKDTWLARQGTELPVVSLDEIRREMGVEPTANQGVVAQAAKELCRKYLRKREDFAFNATNLLRSTRARWLHLFADYDATIDLVYLEPLWKTILRQNRERQERIPEKALQKMADKNEPPTWLETHYLRYLDGQA